MNISLIAMSAILIIAGVAHFINPQTFISVMPSFIPLKAEIVFLTGVVELLFVPALWIDSTRRNSALLLAFYFLCLLPVHLHMALEQIPIGRLAHPAWLWGRVLLQFGLIYWSYSLRRLPLKQEKPSL